MDKYGFQNVRGGSYVKIKLDTTTIAHLQQLSNGTNNKCFICSKEGHFAKDCEENECWETESDDSENESEDEDEDEDESEDEDCCFRCGREGHFASSCYASRDIEGNYLK
jgi:hypothetical protein